jgi:hypothetical protein
MLQFSVVGGVSSGTKPEAVRQLTNPQTITQTHRDKNSDFPKPKHPITGLFSNINFTEPAKIKFISLFTGILVICKRSFLESW